MDIFFIIGIKIFGIVTYYTLSELLKIKFRIHKNNDEENKNMQISGLSFGKAIELLKTGYQLQREGWNGKNQYIELATCISYKNTEGEIINAEHDAIGNKAIAFVGTSGVQLGWLASQSDMLAEDWRIRY